MGHFHVRFTKDIITFELQKAGNICLELLTKVKESDRIVKYV